MAWGPFRKDGFRRELCVVRRWVAVEGPVVVLGERTGLSFELVMSVLKAVAERGGVFVCNHVRLDEPETFETEVFTRGDQRLNISVHRCRSGSCHVNVVLQWRYTWRPRPYVEVQVSRYLDVLSSPNDERWLGQVQEMEERECSTDT